MPVAVILNLISIIIVFLLFISHTTLLYRPLQRPPPNPHPKKKKKRGKKCSILEQFLLNQLMEGGCQIQRKCTDLSVPYALAHSLLLSPSPTTNAIWRSSHQETSVANWCVLSGWEVDCPHIYQAYMCTSRRPETVMGSSPTSTSLFVVPEKTASIL